MNQIRRRKFLQLAGASVITARWPSIAYGAAPHVVVVGGGIAGTVAAKQIAASGTGIRVTLIERNQHYQSLLTSSPILASGMHGSAEYSYQSLGQYGISVIHDAVAAIDTDKNVVTTIGGTSVAYDRLVLAPGIDLNRSAITGYDDNVEARMPHAWTDRDQASALWKQIESMRPGGTVLITVPAGPVSSPAAPYERASHIAHYLKMHNPTAKILICDAKNDFPSSELFKAAWEYLYPGMIDWIGGGETGGNVERVDAGAMTIYFPNQSFSADVASIIPPLSAGSLADKANVRDATGWCPVNMMTFESIRVPGIHVIGDAAIINGLPKSAQIANSQAKICAYAIISAMTGAAKVPVRFTDVDYNVIAPNFAFFSIATYRPDENGDGVIEMSSSRSSPSDSANRHNRNFDYAMSWYNNISHDMFG
jgi:sulfide dehydrogenase [flavocytochrome c] flavoprotein subunit